MNNFINLTVVQRTQKVVYYSVQLEGEDHALFEKFIHRHTTSNKTKLNHILAWLKVLGNKIGAKECYFRNEAQLSDTSALPPKGKNREPVFIELNEDYTDIHFTNPIELSL